MDDQEWIWIALLFGISVALWLLVKPTDPFIKNVKPAVARRACISPSCEPDESGGWGACKDAQGPCELKRQCGYILDCINSLTCTDALGPCIWY